MDLNFAVSKAVLIIFRELQAALHNLATHDGSPPSSTSGYSAASSSPGAPTLSAPVTSITANQCFDGSALFDSTASSAPAEGFLHTTDSEHQPPRSAEAVDRQTRHQKKPNHAKGARSGDCEDQPVAHPLHAADQPGSGLPLQMSAQTSDLMSGQIPSHVPGQTPRQMAGQIPMQVTGQMGQRQQGPGSAGQSPGRSTGHSAGIPASHLSSTSWAKPRSLSQAATKALQQSESSGELMTLEELEHRIASLNKPLLREPSRWQAAPASSDQADTTKTQSLFHAQVQPAPARQQRQRQAGVQSRGDQSGKLGREACQSSDSMNGLAEEEPGMTAWQKLTSKHQVPQGSNTNRFDPVDGQGDSYSSASSPTESRVSAQYLPCKLESIATKDAAFGTVCRGQLCN